MTQTVNVVTGEIAPVQLPTYRAPMSDEEFDTHEARSLGEQMVRIKLRVVPGQGEGHDGRLLAKNRQLTTLSAREYGERYGMNHETVLARLREMDWLIEHGKIHAPEPGKLSEVPTKELAKEARRALAGPSSKPSDPKPVDTGSSVRVGFESDVAEEQADWDSEEKEQPWVAEAIKLDDGAGLSVRQGEVIQRITDQITSVVNNAFDAKNRKDQKAYELYVSTVKILRDHLNFVYSQLLKEEG